MRNAITAGFVVAAASAALAAQSATSQPPSNRPGPVTVRGCLSGGEQTNQFTLTTADDTGTPSSTGTSGGTAASAAKPVVKTVTYTLTPAANVDLKSHVGHTVEIVGAESSPTDEAAASTTTPSTTAPGDVPGGPKAKVQTSAKADIVVKQLNVSRVRMISDKCQVQK